jgi:hypothetical protein
MKTVLIGIIIAFPQLWVPQNASPLFVGEIAKMRTPPLGKGIFVGEVTLYKDGHSFVRSGMMWSMASRGVVLLISMELGLFQYH